MEDKKEEQVDADTNAAVQHLRKSLQLNPTYARLAPYDIAIGAKDLYAIGAVQKQDGTWSDWGVFEVPLNGHTARQLAPISKD